MFEQKNKEQKKLADLLGLNTVYLYERLAEDEIVLANQSCETPTEMIWQLAVLLEQSLSYNKLKKRDRKKTKATQIIKKLTIGQLILYRDVILYELEDKDKKKVETEEE